MTKKGDDDAGSSSATPTKKESPGNRLSSTPTRPTNPNGKSVK